MAAALALLAALAFALGTVLQQRGTLAVDAGEDDPRFLAQILARPVWLAGAGAQLAGWVLQAAALDRGTLVVVQSLSALSLVVALPLGRVLTAQHIGRREILGAGLTLVGIVVFLSAGQPQGGTAHPSSAVWWTASLTVAVLVGGVAVVGLRLQGAGRALAFGAAAGLGFGLQAAVTKTFVGELGGGVLSLLADWSVYVLALSALSGFVLQQSALKTGVLAPAMASANASTLFSSVVLGIVVYGETLARAGAEHGWSAGLGLVLAVTGISVLAGSAPPGPSSADAVHPTAPAP